MMGYLKPLTPDAGVRALYRSYQCGLCHTLGAEYGLVWRLAAGPDLVFYNIFLDLFSESAPVERRACVVAPGVTSLPSRVRTENTRLAAAFGVYMAVAKLEDDWRDDGGWLKWLAWRATRRGQAQARATLAAQGFPIQELEAWMRTQAEVEARPSASLDEAVAPTRAIAALTFGFAGRASSEADRGLASAVGASLGDFLFYLDNLLDLRRDLASGGYNALARAHGLSGASAVAPAVYDAGLSGAVEAVGRLRAAVEQVPAGEPRRYLHETLVRGFQDKVARFRRLPADARAQATLRTVSPPTLGVLMGLRRAAVRPAQLVAARMQLAFALMLLWAFPKRGWANDWWPQDTGLIGLDTGETGDTGETADTGADTSLPVDTGPDINPEADRSALAEWICNPCVSNCGFVECDPVRGCEGAIDDACGSACDAACGDACDSACSGVDCGSGCDCG
jgi:hypothetical protein